MNDGFFAKRFDGIQALRAVAALSVLINHFAFAGNGGFGVDIFFCISGFIMMYVTEKNTDYFISKRLIRIVPLYYLVTLATYAGYIILPELFVSSEPDLLQLVKSLLFIPFDAGGFVKPIVRVGWTLNYEMFFYVIIWCAMHISHRFRGVIASAVIIVIAACGSIFKDMPVPLEFWSDSIMLEFIYGMAAFGILKRITAKRYNITVIYLAISLMCYIFMWYVKYNTALSGITRCVVYGIPAFIIFMGVFLASYDLSLPRSVVFMGDISYSVYLIHYAVVRYFNGITCPDGMLTTVSAAGAAGAIIITIVLSIISYYIIEKRCVAVLSKLIQRHGK